MSGFYNRTTEISALEDAWKAPDSQFILLYGRRRIGKTFLLQHFLGQGKPHCYFLAAQTRLGENMAQLAQSVINCFPGSDLTPADLPTFRSILKFIGQAAEKERLALVLDEFQYLVEQDSSIPSQLQAWWDTDGIRSRIFFVLCGSHLGVMEGLGGPQAPLFGRFTLRHKLPPMNYRDIACFYDNSPYTVRDKLMAYGILGGTPRYHALFDARRDLSANIQDHILGPMGVLHNEPEILLSSSQIRDPFPYNAVLAAISEGGTRPNEISQRTHIPSTKLSFYLKTLMELEWVERETSFGDTSQRRSIYRIADPFPLFWYRFAATLRSELEFQETARVYEKKVEPYLNDYMGRYVFERICHQYLKLKSRGSGSLQLKRAGRYWSRNGRLEIDIVAKQSDGRYLFGECKWSSSPIGVGVYYGLREKTAMLTEIEYGDNPLYALFSLSGFDDNLKRIAAEEGLWLVSGDDLLCGC
ncbi:MAG: ATP-binding protein [bacterium]|nr:ATP-binding protein [bacterium]